jgi:hypothetical protein
MLYSLLYLMVVKVTLDYEFYEVLNAFPILFKFFENDLKLNLNKVIEGESVNDFFDKCDLSLFEKNIVLRRVNAKLREFFLIPSKLAVADDAEVEEEYVDIISSDEEE